MATDNVQHPASVVTRPTVQPVSAAPSAETLTDEQRRQRFAEIRERSSRSQLEVVAPPGLTGYWAPLTDTGEQGRLEWKGFKIVHDDPAPRNRWKANGYRADGTYVIGDVILMEIDTELYEMHLQADRDRGEAMHTGVIPGLKTEMAGREVPTFDVAKSPKKGA